MIGIRPERPDDIAAVRAINEAAFGHTSEADIVDSLRRECPDTVSLVAVEGARVLGHIFFSPAVVSRLRGQVLQCHTGKGTHTLRRD
jgi:putative acetyltransferase